jgi:predicted metalloprotease
MSVRPGSASLRVGPARFPGMHTAMRRALVASLAVSAVSLSGCVRIIDGLPTSLQPPVSAVPDGEITVIGATDNAIDQLARNALADLETFWARTFPEVYGEEFPPLAGGYFSVDPDDVDPSVYPDGVSCGASPLEVENNAFYCQAAGEVNSDSISYDRAFLEELASQFGRFIPDLVMAHEFGHAVQGRVGFPGASINAETQADCFAGAWTAWVAAGEAEHTTIREPELDELLRGYLQLRDPVGTSLREESAHGSYFDRVSAFQEGFADGVVACRDNFGGDRVFTQRSFSSDRELETGGNARPDELPGIIDVTVTPFFEDVVGSAGADFRAPSVEGLDGGTPSCAEDVLDYCEGDGVVAIDSGFAEEIYDIGDFAVISAVAIPFALDAREQLGLSTDDAEAVRSAVCATGAYGRALSDDRIDQPTDTPIAISPGDLDEGVLFLLAYGRDPEVIPDVDLTGFQLVDVFRSGFTRGAESCGLT